MPLAVLRQTDASLPDIPNTTPPGHLPDGTVQTSGLGRKFVQVAGLGRIYLSRDQGVNRAKISTIADRYENAGKMTRDAMALQRLALQALLDLRSRTQLGALNSDEDSALLESLDQTIALSRALLDEASTFVWEQTAVSGRLEQVQEQLP